MSKLDIYVHSVGTNDDRILRLLTYVVNQGVRMSEQLDTLTAEVARVHTVNASVVALLAGLAQQIEDANVDNNPAIAALASDLKSQTDGLAQAVLDGTVTPPIGGETPVGGPAGPVDPVAEDFPNPDTPEPFRRSF